MVAKRNSVRSLLTTETHTLTTAALQNSCWVYVADDLSEEYRAFLMMGVRGLQHYADEGSRTVYSRCVSEPEASDSSIDITFVHRAGAIVRPAPPVDAYLRVLRSPSRAAACYFAYASSLGIGVSVSQVLIQTVVGPFVWGDKAVLPYRSCSPRLDAAPYLLGDTSTLPTLEPLDVAQIVSCGAIIAERLLTALGATITGFANNAKVAMVDVLGAITGLVSSADQSRALISSILSANHPSSVGLHWVDPFRPEVSEGFDRCVHAYRRHHGLLTQFSKSPVRSLQPLLYGGVEMSAGVPGGAMASTRYVETVVYQIVATGIVTCESERLTQGTVPNMALLGHLTAWRPQYNWVRYSARGSAPSKPVATQSADPGPADAQPEVVSKQSPPHHFSAVAPETSTNPIAPVRGMEHVERPSSAGPRVASPTPSVASAATEPISSRVAAAFAGGGSEAGTVRFTSAKPEVPVPRPRPMATSSGATRETAHSKSSSGSSGKVTTTGGTL